MVFALAAVAVLFIPSFTTTTLRRRATFRPDARGGVVLSRANKDWVKQLSADTPIAAGNVMIAAPGSFDHYFLESLVLIIEHSEQLGTRGVLLNHQTPWVTSDLVGDFGAFSENIVFLGGDAGADTMLMLHEKHLVEGSRPLGEGGISEGGVKAARGYVDAGQLRAEQFKFFYKTVEWLPGILEQERADSLWELIELSPSMLLRQEGQRTMWQKVRTMLREEASGALTSAPAPSASPAETEPQSQQVEGEQGPLTSAAGVSTVPGAAEVAAAGGAGAKALAEGQIEDVLEFRTFKGNEQWRVRWRGLGPEADTWEAMRALDSERAVALAVQLRERARGEGDV